MKRQISLAALLAASVVLTGCGSSNDVDTAESSPQSDFRALFSASDGVIPFPNNLLFSGSLDGTLNIPVADPSDYADPQVALNALDGFSTLAPISTTFGSAIDPLSVPGSVRLFEVSLTGIGGAVTDLGDELIFGIDFYAAPSSVAGSENTLVIVPLRPLSASQSYLAVVTRGLKSTAGDPALPDNQYRLAQRTTELTQAEFPLTPADDLAALNGLRQLVNAQEASLANANPALSSADVAVSWVFTTQSVGAVLAQARVQAAGTSANFVPVGDTNSLLPNGSAANAANIYAGTLTLPYYLSNASGALGPLGPLSDFWQGAGASHLTGVVPGVTNIPVKRSDETIPVLVSVPKAAQAPWPVVVFQHGITRNRADLLAVADSFAAAGYAVAAIDMPLHGITPDSALADLRAATPGATERTFDLDLLTQDDDDNVLASAPDGVADSSGIHFINLRSLLTSRDNVRQGAADIFALVQALQTMDIDGGGADFDASRIGFAGHSLGGMVGSVALAHESGIGASVLAMPGGGIAKVLDGSPSFGPSIAAGLAAAGVDKGTAEYEQFMAAAQTVLDAADPINNADATVDAHPVLLYQVNGDTVIPNTVPVPGDTATVASPTSGTAPLAAAMALTDVSATTSGAGLDARVTFTAGDHRSLLDPTSSLAATTVMHNAMVTFVASGGASLPIADTSVVE
jgi:dienelactone hydrolase